MYNLQLNAPNWQDVKGTLEALALPPRYRRLLISRISRLVIRQAQKNIEAQKTVDGVPMQPRKRLREKLERAKALGIDAKLTKSDKTPLLKNLARTKWMRVKMFGPDEGQVFYPRGVGYVANKHQLGISEHFDMKLDKDFPAADAANKCTQEQAFALIRYGFKLGGHRPNKDWIMERITVGHARGLLKKHKQRWMISLPARPFLGVGASEIQSYREYVMQSLHDKFRAKNYNG